MQEISCKVRIKHGISVQYRFVDIRPSPFSVIDKFSTMASESSDTVHPQEEADGDALCETIMAIDMKESGQVGCAYYVASEEALCLQEDIAMAGMVLVETLLLHAQPTTVIITNRAPDKLIEYLESGAQRVDSDQGMRRVSNLAVFPC